MPLRSHIIQQHQHVQPYGVSVSIPHSDCCSEKKEQNESAAHRAHPHFSPTIYFSWRCSHLFIFFFLYFRSLFCVSVCLCVRVNCPCPVPIFPFCRVGLFPLRRQYCLLFVLRFVAFRWAVSFLWTKKVRTKINYDYLDDLDFGLWSFNKRLYTHKAHKPTARFHHRRHTVSNSGTSFSFSVFRGKRTNERRERRAWFLFSSVFVVGTEKIAWIWKRKSFSHERNRNYVVVFMRALCVCVCECEYRDEFTYMVYLVV